MKPVNTFFCALAALGLILVMGEVIRKIAHTSTLFVSSVFRRATPSDHVYETGDAVHLVPFITSYVQNCNENGATRRGIVSVSVSTARRKRLQQRRGAIRPPASIGRALPFRAEQRDVLTSSVHDIHWPTDDTDKEKVLSVDRSLLDSFAVRRLRVAPSLRVVFCPIPGVAAASLTKLLENAESSHELLFLANFSVRDRERLLLRSDAFRFLFVRHPFVRALSVYYNGVLGKALDDEEYRQFMAHVRGVPLAANERELQPLSLLFLLTSVGRQRADKLWDRFMPQVTLCRLDRLKYNLVGRLENLHTGLQQLQTSLNHRLPTLGPRSHGTNATITARGVYKSRKCRLKAMKVYGNDLQVLGYRPDVYDAEAVR